MFHIKFFSWLFLSLFLLFVVVLQQSSEDSEVSSLSFLLKVQLLSSLTSPLLRSRGKKNLLFFFFSKCLHGGVRRKTERNPQNKCLINQQQKAERSKQSFLCSWVAAVFPVLLHKWAYLFALPHSENIFHNCFQRREAARIHEGAPWPSEASRFSFNLQTHRDDDAVAESNVVGKMSSLTKKKKAKTEANTWKEKK